MSAVEVVVRQAAAAVAAVDPVSSSLSSRLLLLAAQRWTVAFRAVRAPPHPPVRVQDGPAWVLHDQVDRWVRVVVPRAVRR
ncbi:MAG: hypothetical protein JOY61_04045 [Chloroflexi bacterium]|nr:hypothetical protein [Chloroflexota bacterium]